jgi:predicted dehydrogenase
MGGIHARAVRAAGATVSRVASHSPESARRAAAQLGAAAVAGSAEELIESDDVDVIHICTPNHLHAALAEQALGAGKHVVCEKPLATTTDDARRLAQLAAASGRTATVPFVYRFYPTVREARARIAGGEAGGLWLLHGSYLQDWLAGPQESNWRVDPALGGASRAFGDIGVHWCDLMEFVTGHRIVRLTAAMSRAFDERPGSNGGDAATGATSTQAVSTEDGATVLFQTDAGATGSVVVSQVSPGRKNRLAFSFDGPSASYRFDSESPDTLTVGGRTDNRVVPRDPNTLHPAAAAYVTVPAGHPQGYQDCFNAFVADTYAAVGGDRPDGLPTFADGYRAAMVTAAVVESARSGRWVEVPSDPSTLPGPLLDRSLVAS